MTKQMLPKVSSARVERDQILKNDQLMVAAEPSMSHAESIGKILHPKPSHTPLTLASYLPNSALQTFPKVEPSRHWKLTDLLPKQVLTGFTPNAPVPHPMASS